MGSDYIRTARAKGLSRASILLKHALRNAAIPVVAIAAVQLGFMLGGSIVIEQVFALHGVGFLAWESDRQERLPRGAGGRAGAGGDLRGAHHAGRPDERRARSAAARRMSVVVGHGRPQARLEERQHLDRRAHRRASPLICAIFAAAAGAARSLRPGSRASACCRRSGWPAPTPSYLLGTDQLGRDYLSRLIYGAASRMMIGVTVTVVSGLIGITLGVLGGFLGGRVDDAVLFAITTRLSHARRAGGAGGGRRCSAAR